MPRPRPGNRCGLMALSKTILLLRAYVANSSIATTAFCSSVIATNKKSKAYVRRPRGARNQPVTIRPKVAHMKLESCKCMFSAQARFLEFEVEGARKREEVMVYCLFWH